MRHDPAQKLYGIVLFGEPGPREPDDPLWSADTDRPIPAELIDEASRALGYRVLPTP